MKQFKAESKRLLDLMINSIYTHKEIFLRELISNASDAIDKRHFLSLTNTEAGLASGEYEIFLQADKELRTLTISDNGLGMDKAALEGNLGVIAASGSLAFRKENEAAEDVDIIGQFGVGFYSAFMVASQVRVISRAFGESEAYCWQSKGAQGYEVKPAQRDEVGTDIILVFKEDEEDERYSEFLEEHRLRGLVEKYSDYIRYPIKMTVHETRPKKDVENEYEEVEELRTLNSMVPLWKRDKAELTEEDYAAFYKEKFSDFEAPAKVIQSNTEGTATYNALLFVPSRTPYNYYSKEYEKGLQLYASGVMIMQKCADLLPDHFSFVRGLVDSQDLSLNISREMLQHDRQLQLIRKSLERKIRSELGLWLKNDREAYEVFFKNFGLQLKVGLYQSFGAESDNLKDLLLFYAAKDKKMATLAEYCANMPEEQKYIYYAAGDSIDRLSRLPQAEMVLGKGFDLFLLTDDVDEFTLSMLRQYDEKEFRNISGGDLGLESEEEKEEIEKQNESNKDLFDFLKESLDGKVTQVKVSGRLKNHPVILTSEGGLSMEMEKVLNSMPGENKVESQKVLEINAEHPLFAKLQTLQSENQELLKTYAGLLYNQALLIEGLPVEDPVAFSNDLSKILAQ